MNENLKSLSMIERSIIKRYRKNIWAKFVKGVKQYELIKEGDKIAVAISGGKDSLLLAKLMQELQKHGQFHFELEFIAMDPGYNPENRKRLEQHCEYLGIPANIYNSDIFEVSEKLSKESPCYMCARMRRGSLYSKAQELGCNKLALGHHFDDVIETTMLNILMSGSFKTMMPKLKSDNFENMELIRPMFLIREDYIIRWRNYTGLNPLDCACEVAAKKTSGSRFMVKQLISEMKEYNDVVDINIFRAAENVHADAILGWKKDGSYHNFLDNYDI